MLAIQTVFELHEYLLLRKRRLRLQKACLRLSFVLALHLAVGEEDLQKLPRCRSTPNPKAQPGKGLVT